MWGVRVPLFIGPEAWAHSIAELALQVSIPRPSTKLGKKRGRDTIQLEDTVSTISQEYLQEFASEYYIPESLHPELPGPEDNIVDFPEGKIGVYTKFFEFANYRIPISQFLFDILANVQEKNTPQCYSKRLDSLKNWNNRFFWVDERVFPIVVDWRTSTPKDERPAADSNSAEDLATLNLHRTPIQKQLEELLCLVGLSRNYFLRDDEYPIFLYDDDREMDLFNAPNPLKVKTMARPHLSHEVPLLTATATRVINMENTPATSVSSDTPPVIVKSPLDFSNEESLQLLTEGDETETQVPAAVAPEVPRAENPATMEVVPELNLEKEAAAMGPPLNKRRRKRDKGEAEANAPPKILRKDHASVRPQPSTAAVLQSVSEPDPISYAQPQPLPKHDIAQSSKKAAAAEDSDSEKSISFTSMGDPYISLGYFLVLRHLPNDDFLSQYNVNLARQVAMGSQLRLRFEQEAKLLKKAVARGQVTGEEKIKAAFEEFKKYEDDRVTSRCAEMDARLDALSIDFNEELYPHMLTAIAGRQWVIGHGLHLDVIKCAESMELRQVFVNVVSTGIAKGMSEGLKHGVEHGKAKLDLAAVEAYDPEADDKFTIALQALKDVEYPLVDQLERLKDAPIDLIMASLHLESDTGDDAPQFIRDLRPSSSQLKILVYPEVRDPKDLWAFKEEILLEGAIAANISHAEKKKSRVVCRTHGVGSAHHVRSDGVPVCLP
ncbi:hypothetical protein Tco_0410821 [Tanacetum coccineum]